MTLRSSDSVAPRDLIRRTSSTTMDAPRRTGAAAVGNTARGWRDVLRTTTALWEGVARWRRGYALVRLRPAKRLPLTSQPFDLLRVRSTLSCCNVSKVRWISQSNQSTFTMTCQPGSLSSILDTRAAPARPPPRWQSKVGGGGGTEMPLPSYCTPRPPTPLRPRRGRVGSTAGGRPVREPAGAPSLPIGHPPTHRAPTRPRPALSARAATVVVCRPAPPPPPHLSLFAPPPARHHAAPSR